MKNTEDGNVAFRNELDKLKDRIVSSEKQHFNHQYPPSE